MAVVSFNWIHDGRTGGGDTLEGEITRTRVARVRTDTNTDGEAVILAAANANGAAIGAAHPDGGGVYLQRRSADNISASKVIWIVTCHYSNKLIDNPLDEPAKIKVAGQLFTAPILFDADGQLICNSAGMPLVDPSPEADFPRRLITVKKNIATPDLADPCFALQNTLNQEVVTIWPSYGGGMAVGVKKAKLREPEIDGPETRNGIDYFVLSLSIDWRSEGWDDPLVDCGYQYRTSTGKLVKATQDGTEANQPILLDGSGQPLLNPGPTNFYQIVPKRYLTASWAAIIALI